MTVKPRFILFLLLFSFNNSSFGLENIHSFWNKADTFFLRYVQDGLVDYKSIVDKPSELDSLISFIKNTKEALLAEDDKKAFLINSYNLFVIKGIVEKYPATSPQSINNFFTQKSYYLFNKKISLNELEKDLLLRVYQDPRLHFVLVCGAIGCPKISNEAYLPSRLDDQIELKTVSALNESSFIRVKSADSKVIISEIFNWYQSDFASKESSIIDYINQYRTEKIPNSYRVEYYEYDWNLNEQRMGKGVSNIQAYTPSVLLKKGQFETQLFNNIYTQNAFRGSDGKRVKLGSRDTYYTALFYFLIGITSKRNLNIGIDANFKSVRIDPNPNSSLFKVLKFHNDSISRTTITSLGPKVKLQPIKKWSGFSIQSAFWFPVTNDLESDSLNQPWLSYNRYTWWNQFFLDKKIGVKWRLFSEADLLFRIAKSNKKYHNQVAKKSILSTPISSFLSYFPSNKSTIYSMIQIAPSFEFDRNNFLPSSAYAQVGIGGKYQLSESLNVELLLSNFFASINGGAGSTVNLGLRYLK